MDSVESVVDEDVVSVEEDEYEYGDESSDESDESDESEESFEFERSDDSETSYESDGIEETTILRRTHDHVFMSNVKKISLKTLTTEYHFSNPIRSSVFNQFPHLIRSSSYLNTAFFMLFGLDVEGKIVVK